MTDSSEPAPHISEHATTNWQRIVEIALLVLVQSKVAGVASFA